MAEVEAFNAVHQIDNIGNEEAQAVVTVSSWPLAIGSDWRSQIDKRGDELRPRRWPDHAMVLG